MKYYTIIGGVNGVGKSSLTGVLKKQRTDMGMIIDTDMLNAKYNGDRIKGGKEAVRLINDCLSKGIDFTQETTLSGKKTYGALQTVLPRAGTISPMTTLKGAMPTVLMTCLPFFRTATKRISMTMKTALKKWANTATGTYSLLAKLPLHGLKK